MERFGYHGKILRVDLSAHRSWVEEPGENWWRLYAGGGLLATEQLLRHTKPGIDPLGPDNLLILTSSVVAGHPYAGLVRFTVAAKSPLTGGIGETRCEGPFANALKASGVDAIIVHGRASRPTTLEVENGQASFHDASELWGMTTDQTVDALQTDHGPDSHVAAIGPAGENLVRFASIVADRNHQAARMGMGAVAGSKRFKAIVIKGHNPPPVADPDRCQALTTYYAAKMRENDLTKWQLEPPGFAAWVHLLTNDTAICALNYRESSFKHASAYDPDQFMRRFAGDSPCPGCPNSCIKVFGAGDDSRFNPRSGGIHQEITGAMGPNLGIRDLDTVLAANIRCNELGMDPTSLGFTISMAMECREEGILSTDLANEIPPFGDSVGTLDLVERIATRKGAGDLLAEGAKRAATQIGNGAERFALHVKGLEMVPFEPRTQAGLALGFATASIGPRFDIAEHDWDFDVNAGWEHSLENARTLGILQRMPMQTISAEKVRNYKILNTLWSAADVLDFCIFAIAPVRLLTMQQMTEMLAAVTGWNTSSYEIMQLGERRNQLMRVYNLREGITSAADTLPDRFFDDPIVGGPRDGQRIDRATFSNAVRTYYRMMGWNDIGRPHYETLVDHHLEWTVAEGHLPRA